MGTAAGPNIVTDNLKLFFDASNPKSYPGSGTTWYDLSGNGNHGTLLNSPTFSSDKGGCFILDGTNDRISFNTTFAKTICFWGRLSSDFVSLAALVAKSAGGDGSFRVQRVDGDGRFSSNPNTNDFHKGSGLAEQLMMNGESNLPTLSNKFITPNGRTMLQDFYVGALGSGFNFTTISHNFTHNSIARRYKGRVYAVLLYNRHLTFSELLQNYNSFRWRFGI